MSGTYSTRAQLFIDEFVEDFASFLEDHVRVANGKASPESIQSDTMKVLNAVANSKGLKKAFKVVSITPQGAIAVTVLQTALVAVQIYSEMDKERILRNARVVKNYYRSFGSEKMDAIIHQTAYEIVRIFEHQLSMIKNNEDVQKLALFAAYRIFLNLLDESKVIGFNRNDFLSALVRDRANEDFCKQLTCEDGSHLKDQKIFVVCGLRDEENVLFADPDTKVHNYKYGFRKKIYQWCENTNTYLDSELDTHCSKKYECKEYSLFVPTLDCSKYPMSLESFIERDKGTELEIDPTNKKENKLFLRVRWYRLAASIRELDRLKTTTDFQNIIKNAEQIGLIAEEAPQLIKPVVIEALWQEIIWIQKPSIHGNSTSIFSGLTSSTESQALDACGIALGFAGNACPSMITEQMFDFLISRIDGAYFADRFTAEPKADQMKVMSTLLEYNACKSAASKALTTLSQTQGQFITKEIINRLHENIKVGGVPAWAPANLKVVAEKDKDTSTQIPLWITPEVINAFSAFCCVKTEFIETVFLETLLNLAKATDKIVGNAVAVKTVSSKMSSSVAELANKAIKLQECVVQGLSTIAGEVPNLVNAEVLQYLMDTMNSTSPTIQGAVCIAVFKIGKARPDFADCKKVQDQMLERINYVVPASTSNKMLDKVMDRVVSSVSGNKIPDVAIKACCIIIKAIPDFVNEDIAKALVASLESDTPGVQAMSYVATSLIVNHRVDLIDVPILKNQLNKIPGYNSKSVYGSLFLALLPIATATIPGLSEFSDFIVDIFDNIPGYDDMKEILDSIDNTIEDIEDAVTMPSVSLKIGGVDVLEDDEDDEEESGDDDDAETVGNVLAASSVGDSSVATTETKSTIAASEKTGVPAAEEPRKRTNSKSVAPKKVRGRYIAPATIEAMKTIQSTKVTEMHFDEFRRCQYTLEVAVDVLKELADAFLGSGHTVARGKKNSTKLATKINLHGELGSFSSKASGQAVWNIMEKAKMSDFITYAQLNLLLTTEEGSRKK